jgi:hypothetical protein
MRTLSAIFLARKQPTNLFGFGWTILCSSTRSVEIARQNISRRRRKFLTPDQFSKGRSKEKTQLQGLEFFLLRSPPV